MLLIISLDSRYIVLTFASLQLKGIDKSILFETFEKIYVTDTNNDQLLTILRSAETYSPRPQYNWADNQARHVYPRVLVLTSKCLLDQKGPYTNQERQLAEVQQLAN